MDKPVVVFDGVCNLCNAAIDFVIRRDKAGQFHFASNQSERGQEILATAGVRTFDADSVVLSAEGEYFVSSDAVLQIARRLGFPWKAAYAFAVVPRPIRDAVYRLVAQNRYRLFGQRETCRVPTPAERERFLG